MLQFEELRLELAECEKPLTELAEALGLDEMKKEIAALEEQTAAPGFWEDLKTAQRVQQQMSSLKSRVDAYDRLKADYDDALMMIELSDEEEDESMFPDCRESVDKIKRELDKQTLSTLLSGEYDSKNALLTFHAGAGGTEAQDWVSMLVRMYMHWGEQHGYK
ncbi:MAG: PCRF domain-containing protein, partial [Clostridia bacterium]|nr:PCRF domain-containing protein [Clostridia bacterium]